MKAAMKNNIFRFFCAALLASCCQVSLSSETVRHIQNGIQIETAGYRMRVQFYSDHAVRILKWLPEAAPDSSSLAVIQKELPDINLHVEENDAAVILKSDKLQIRISKAGGIVEFLTADNTTILKERGKAVIQPADLKNEKAYSIKQEFELTPDEGIYGLGQHQDGWINKRGHTVKLVQANTDAVTPFLISTMNYGILWDNYSKTIFTDDKNETSLWSDVANCIDYYFIYGNTMDSVIAGYRNLTGQAPMYGKWAYGYWQSKEHYASRDELLGVADEYRKRQIPIDNIVQDWDYWGGAKNWSQLFFDEKLYPHPKEMIDRLHEQNFHLMISVWPG
jgi:alpha-D-xyloside xylohydrolase